MVHKFFVSWLVIGERERAKNPLKIKPFLHLKLNSIKETEEEIKCRQRSHSLEKKNVDEHHLSSSYHKIP